MSTSKSDSQPVFDFAEVAVRKCAFCGGKLVDLHPRRVFCSHACKLANRRLTRPHWDGVLRESARCPRCRKTKSSSEFYSDKHAVTGLATYCKTCVLESMRVDYAENPDKYRAQQKQSWILNRGRWLVHAAKRRAKKLGVPFDLDQHVPAIQARIDAGRCELSGVVFVLEQPGGQRQFNSATIDRIDTARGYVYGNIRVVCWLMNGALGNWGEAILQEVMRVYLARVDATASQSVAVA